LGGGGGARRIFTADEHVLELIDSAAALSRTTLCVLPIEWIKEPIAFPEIRSIVDLKPSVSLSEEPFEATTDGETSRFVVLTFLFDVETVSMLSGYGYSA